MIQVHESYKSGSLKNVLHCNDLNYVPLAENKLKCKTNICIAALLFFFNHLHEVWHHELLKQGIRTVIFSFRESILTIHVCISVPV